MNKPFKFRYVNQLAGGFALLVIGLLLAGVFVAGRAQQWFAPVREVRIMFPPDGTSGLQRGGEARILGTLIGSVDRIRVLDDDRLEATIKIRGEFIRFLRADSVAVVKKKFGVAGDAFVEFTVGKGAPLPRADAVLPCRKDTEIMEIAQELLENLQQTALPAVEEATALLREHRRLAEKLNATMVEVDAIIKNARTFSDELPAAATVVRGEVQQAAGVTLQAQATLREAEQTLAGLQRHWLLRGAMSAAPALPETRPDARGADSDGEAQP